MPISDETPEVDEEIWHAWIQRGKLQEHATIRKLRAAAGIVMVLLGVGSVYYFSR
jgi:hypothetical protein